VELIIIFDQDLETIAAHNASFNPSGGVLLIKLIRAEPR